MSSANRVLLFPFQLGFFYLFFFSDGYGLDFQNCWIVVVRLGTLVLFLIFRGNVFCFFSIEDNVCVSLSYMAFITLRYVSSIPAFCRVLIISHCCILSKAFSASTEIIIWLVIFQFVKIVYCIDWFANIEESLHSWGKAHLVMTYDPLNMLLDLVC